MEEVLASSQHSAQVKIKLDYCAILNAQLDIKDGGSIAIKNAQLRQDGLTKVYFVENTNMEEEQATLGNLVILSMIVECLEDAKMIMDKVIVKNGELLFTQNVVQAMVRSDVAFVDQECQIAGH